MDILAKLFGSDAKLKIIRLFLFNPGVVYDIQGVSERTKLEKRAALKEIDLLKKIRLISSKTVVLTEKIIVGPSKKKVKNKAKLPPKIIIKKKKMSGWILNPNFVYLKDLQSLLINTVILNEEEITKRLLEVGRVRLIIVSGFFIQSSDSRLDILIVGDKVNKPKLANIVKKMEHEIGKELRYSYLDYDEFAYRMRIFDKLVRDVLDYPHRVLVDKVGMALSFK